LRISHVSVKFGSGYGDTMQRTILVAEDDAALAAILHALFDEEGYAVHSVSDGTSALRQVERAPPDLVISDISMPGIDGVRLSEELRRRGVLIPIVLVSAVVKSVRLPGVTFIAKPFDLDDLVGTVRRILADCA
jgi:two-component system, sensor histidine kinase and response regulator